MTKSDSGKYLCLLCGTSIANSGHVKRHFDSKHKIPEVVYTCPSCGRVYNIPIAGVTMTKKLFIRHS